MRLTKNPEGGLRRRVGIPAVAAAGVLAVGAALLAGVARPRPSRPHSIR